MITTAAFGHKRASGKIECRLCPAHCKLGEGKYGICGSRFVQDGVLMTDNYGELVTLAIDPIAKKPLYHFFPGSSIVSNGANGCNFKCLNCQNWAISQEKTHTTSVEPGRLAEAAAQNGSIGLAFTYTEPMIWFEFIRDTAPLLREAGLKVVLVSNGYVDPEPLEELIPLMDAINVDLKGIRPEFYRRVCKGKIEPILNNIRCIADSTVHLEITNLIIPGLNDSGKDLTDLFDFVASVSDMIPLHLSAYHPDFKLDIDATSPDTLLRARDLARERLKYVYLGNIAAESDTHCPSCGSLLIQRQAYRTLVTGLDGTACAACGFATGIVR